MKILQLFPADGFYAVYEDKKGEFYSKLIAFALVEEEGEDGKTYTEIKGIDVGSEIFFCEDCANFVQYIYEKSTEFDPSKIR